MGKLLLKNRQKKEERKIEPPDIPSPNKKEKENHEFILNLLPSW